MSGLREAAISSIEYYLPEARLSNETISQECPGRTADEIFHKTGIKERAIAATDESALDLGAKAAEALFSRQVCRRDQIDYVLMSSAAPEYLIPSTASLLQERLGLPTCVGALDINAGCASFVYALALAKGLVETAQADRVLIIIAETYTKFIRRDDRSTRSVFGDAGAATLVESRGVGMTRPSTDLEGGRPSLGPFVAGSDGRGGSHLRMPKGALRQYWCAEAPFRTDRTPEDAALYMNGAAIVEFARSTVPGAVRQLCQVGQTPLPEIDLFVFHQASAFVLDQIRAALHLPSEKVLVELASCGNTGACSIPIALKRAERKGVLREGSRVALVGFGAGYAWAAGLAAWVPCHPKDLTLVGAGVMKV